MRRTERPACLMRRDSSAVLAPSLPVLVRKSVSRRGGGARRLRGWKKSLSCIKHYLRARALKPPPAIHVPKRTRNTRAGRTSRAPRCIARPVCCCFTSATLLHDVIARAISTGTSFRVHANPVRGGRVMSRTLRASAQLELRGFRGDTPRRRKRDGIRRTRRTLTEEQRRTTHTETAQAHQPSWRHVKERYLILDSPNRGSLQRTLSRNVISALTPSQYSPRYTLHDSRLRSVTSGS